MTTSSALDVCFATYIFSYKHYLQYNIDTAVCKFPISSLRSTTIQALKNGVNMILVVKSNPEFYKSANHIIVGVGKAFLDGATIHYTPLGKCNIVINTLAPFIVNTYGYNIKSATNLCTLLYKESYDKKIVVVQLSTRSNDLWCILVRMCNNVLQVDSTTRDLNDVVGESATKRQRCESISEPSEPTESNESVPVQVVQHGTQTDACTTASVCTQTDNAIQDTPALEILTACITQERRKEILSEFITKIKDLDKLKVQRLNFINEEAERYKKDYHKKVDSDIQDLAVKLLDSMAKRLGA